MVVVIRSVKQVHEGEIVIKGTFLNTTHHQMELLAVIRSLEYLQSNPSDYGELIIYTDSQYLMGIESKKERIVRNNYLTEQGAPIRNRELVKRFIQLSESFSGCFQKIKAHSRIEDLTGYNRKVDKLSRKTLREFVHKAK